jgi:nitrate/nitrite transport system substrate-binding protein|nr:ABC transporter substrate-binding protein [Sulfitobacter sp. M22]
MKNTLALLLASTSLLATAASADMLALEKEELTFGFIKLTDMAPLAVAYELGYFEDEGLFVTLQAQANWKVNRPGFTGGQNFRRIAHYGTVTQQEDLEAVFT